MTVTISLGVHDFAEIRQSHYFYVDKTQFLCEWWTNGAKVTLLTRPRRFGKTLMLNTVEHFFSNTHPNQADLFHDLAVWQNAALRQLAGTFPVVSLSFSGAKGASFASVRLLIVRAIARTLDKFSFLKTSNRLTDNERQFFQTFSTDAPDDAVQYALLNLTTALEKHFQHKVIVLLDEYDTPMQEAWLGGFWDELVKFLQPLTNLTFKDNDSLARGLLTGITRVAKESIFSDLNNPDVITTTSEAYRTAFGFTEAEVFAAMDSAGLTNHADVKAWYDGFSFGSARDIYNPWSITSFLRNRKLLPYWANTSNNELAGRLIQTSGKDIKQDFERLLKGEAICTAIAEEIIFKDIQNHPTALWSLLLASGYLKITANHSDTLYDLALTNREVRFAFETLISRWFTNADSNYSEFILALQACDVDAMNQTMNGITQSLFSFFDAGSKNPERFYHGFVLGLLVSLKERYIITSNRESGFGRYDVVLEPIDKTRDNAFILEFKVRRPDSPDSAQESLQKALKQIEDKAYATDLIARGMPSDRIHRFGLVFEGKNVLIG